jgi:hypothetical protein
LITMMTGDRSAIAWANCFCFLAFVEPSSRTIRTCGHQSDTCFCQAGITAFGQHTRMRVAESWAIHRRIRASVVAVFPEPMPWWRMAQARPQAQFTASS